MAISARGATWLLVLVLPACGPQHPSDVGLDLAERISLARVDLLSPATDFVLDIAPAEDEGEPLVAPPPFSPGIFPCSRCHASDEVERATGPLLPHDRHYEMGMDCDACHDATASRAQPETCYECHPAGGAQPSAAVAAYYAAYGDETGRLVIPHRWETLDVEHNHAGHAAVGITCDECHGEAPFERPQPAALMATCVACHQQLAVSIDCQTCHREIRESQHANVVLQHAESIGSCFDCHDVADRDFLRLANGTTVPFEQSYRLCGQCHGTRLRDWRQGLHGKRVGQWDGQHQYLLCVHCHRDPHDPGFPAMAPYAPPPRPESIR